MKYCEKCKVDVIGDPSYCPLCQNELKGRGDERESNFPVVTHKNPAYYLLLKIIIFIGIAGSIISILLNTIFYKEIWWSLFVVVTLICVCISVNIAVSRHKNILKYLLQQSIVFCLFALSIDYFSSWNGWAMTFVIPVIFTLTMIVMFILSKVLHLQPGDYMIYLLLDALFGIIPIISIGSDSVKMDIPSLICIVVSVLSVTGLVVFEGPKMYNELKRRFHV